jgi:hypothetical protein
MKINMLFLALIMLVLACKKSSLVDCKTPTNDLALCKELIVGKWAWARSEIYARNPDSLIISRPTSISRLNLDFKANGIVETYIDGQLMDTSSYVIYDLVRFSKSDSGRVVLDFRQYGNRFGQPVGLRICEDSLFLPYSESHGANEFYNKVK